MRFAGISGSCGSGLVLQSVGVAFSSKRFITVVNSDKYKGAALLGVVGGLLPVSQKSVVVSKGSVHRVPSVGLEERVKCIMRRNKLFPRFAMGRGLRVIPRLRKLRPRGQRRQVGRLLSVMGLSPGLCDGDCPYRLSNKRHREIKITETFTASSSLVLVSRPFSTLSPLAERRLRSRVIGLRGRCRGAVMFIARSVSRTVGYTSGVYFVRGKAIVRFSGARRVLERPTGSCIRGFMKGGHL